MDLYARRYQGRRLGLGEYVLCADEKTSIQARVRRHPSLAASPGRAMRVEHEYERAGALAYLAAWDVHRARLFGRCERSTGILPFGRLVEQIMAKEPYRSARRVFLIVDNGTWPSPPTRRPSAAARSGRRPTGPTPASCANCSVNGACRSRGSHRRTSWRCACWPGCTWR